MQTQIQSRTIQQFSFKFHHQDCQVLMVPELDSVLDICCFCCPHLSALGLPFISLEKPNGRKCFLSLFGRQILGRWVPRQRHQGARPDRDSWKQLWWTEDSNNMQNDVWLTVQSDGHWHSILSWVPMKGFYLCLDFFGYYSKIFLQTSHYFCDLKLSNKLFFCLN